MLLPESDPQGWAVKAIREAGNSYLAELRGLDESQLGWRPSDDELSIKELTAHVRDASVLALEQIEALLASPGRRLPSRDVDLLLMELDYRSADLLTIAAEFRESRRELVGILWGLRSREWDATGIHPYRGPVSLATIAGELARHDLEHLWHVRRVKASLGGRVRVTDDWDDLAV